MSVVSQKIEIYKKTEILISQIKFYIGSKKYKAVKWEYKFYNKEVVYNSSFFTNHIECFEKAKRFIDQLRSQKSFKPTKLKENIMGLPKRNVAKKENEMEGKIGGSSATTKRSPRRKPTSEDTSVKTEEKVELHATKVKEKVAEKGKPMVKKEKPTTVKEPSKKIRSVVQVQKSLDVLKASKEKQEKLVVELAESLTASKETFRHAAHSIVAFGNLILANQNPSFEDLKTFSDSLKRSTKEIDSIKSKLEDEKEKLVNLKEEEPLLRKELKAAINLMSIEY